MGLVLSLDHDPPQSGSRPTTGKRMTLTITLASTGESYVLSEYKRQKVTSDWTVLDLRKPVEVRFRVSSACQRFLYLGREALPCETLQQVLRCQSPPNIPDSFKISLDVNGKDVFPEQLPSFVPIPVPLTDSDMERPKSDQKNGFFWTLSRKSQVRMGLTGGSQIQAFVSPLHPLTLDAAAREVLCIPEDAATFGFSHPAPDWKTTKSDASADPYDADWTEPSVFEQAPLVLECLSVGAYAYFNSKGALVAMNTLRPRSADESSFKFAGPQVWLPEWTKALAEQNRLQPITLKVLWDTGARYFAWLLPGEQFLQPSGKPCERQPNITHGAFAYIFRSDPYTEDPEEVCLDRYFAVVGAESSTDEPEVAPTSPESRQSVRGDGIFELIPEAPERVEDFLADAGPPADSFTQTR